MRRKEMKKYFLFDCETGGINPKNSLFSLYGIILNNELQQIDEIHLKIKPDNGLYQLSAEALKINKIDIVGHNEIAVAESLASSTFYDFACKHALRDKLVPAGHNLSLDIRFVKKHLLKEDNPDGDNWGKFFSHRRLDTATIAHFLILSGKLPSNLDCSLESLARYFEFDYSGAHDEKFDAHLTLDVLKKLITLVDGAPQY